jgi:hypothetical protein
MPTVTIKGAVIWEDEFRLSKSGSRLVGIGGSTGLESGGLTQVSISITSLG